MVVRRRRRSRRVEDPLQQAREAMQRFREPLRLTKREQSNGLKRRIRNLEKLIRCIDRPKSQVELNAYRRQLDDLQHGRERGLVWDEAEAQRAVESFKLLKHYKGRQAGKPFALRGWQEEGIVAPLFGWYWGGTREEGGRRRFRQAYIEIPRKNGKTALAAGLIHKLALYDDEPGAEVYCLAGSAEQATTLFDKFVKGLMGPAHLEVCRVLEYDIAIPDTQSIIKLLSSKDSTAHSYDPHGFVLDEVHVQPSRKLWEAMVTGQGARENPMAIGITTAGWDRSSFCWEMHEDARQILDPEHPSEDDSIFGFIATLDEGDDWTNADVWPKANPNYGITVTEAYYETEVGKAKRSPGKANEVRQLNFDEWTQGEVHWINLDEWDAAEDDSIDDEYLQSLPCFGGLDIGDKRDLSGFTMTFWDAVRDLYIWKGVAWAPQESISDRADRDRAFVKRWIEQGFVRPMPGKGTDEKIIARDIAALIRKYNIRQFAYDPSGTIALIFQVLGEEHGLNLTEDGGIATEFSQTFPNFSPVMNEFSTLLVDGRFAHDGNPLLRWQASNLVVKKNHKDQIMCDKAKSAEKIDNMVAGFMSLALAWEAEDEPEVHEYRGALTL